MNINPEDNSKINMPNEKAGTCNEKDFDEDESGNDLDIPGSELDDEDEKVGNEDEENNYYSLGEKIWMRIKGNENFHYSNRKMKCVTI